MKPREMINTMNKYVVNEYINCIKLDANERYDLDISNVNASSIMFNRYPDNDAKELKTALSEYLSVDDTNLVLGNGSSEMIELLLKSYIDPGDKVLGFTPSFVMYKVFTEIYNGNYVGVESKDGYVMDIDDMISAYKKYDPKIIFLCNPNNPTGFLFRKNDIERLIKNVDCLVVVDEAYIEFTEGSMINRIGNYKNLVILRTFSKAWGLAAARLGYMIASEEIIDVISMVKPPYNLNQITQSIGINALKNTAVLSETVNNTIEQRERVYGFLTRLDIKLYRSAANFLYFKSSLNLFDKLKMYGVLIRSFGNGYYRVTIGSEKENDAFMECMGKLFSTELDVRSVV